MMNLTKRKDAVSSVFSLFLILMIISTSTASILGLVLPAINEMKADATSKQMSEKFDDFYETISKAISSGTSAYVTEHMVIEDGSLDVDSEGDRLVAWYSFDPEWNFNVSGLEPDEDDSGETLGVVDLPSGKSVDKAVFYWLNNTCFLAGTKVLMADNSYKNIEDVKIGDYVKSYDEIDDVIINCRINWVFHHDSFEMGDYYLVFNNFLGVTPNHRFYSDGEWIYAEDLEIGDFLFCLDAQDICVITSVERVYDKVSTYDFGVNFCHNYFVLLDDAEVLVHNDLSNYICDNYDAQAYEGTATDGTFNEDDFEFTSGAVGCDYEKIAVDNDGYVEDSSSNAADNNEYQYHRFDFTIDEPVSSITKIDITWKGYGGNSRPNYGYSLWVKSNNIYIEKVAGTSSSKDILSWSTSDTDEIENITQNGHIYCAAQSDYSVSSPRDSLLRSYYVQVNVTYTQVAPEITCHITYHYPINGSIDVPVSPGCNVSVYDENGNNLYVKIQENTTGDWSNQIILEDVTSGSTISWDFVNATEPNTKYWWRVIMKGHDSSDIQETYYFITSKDPVVTDFQEPWDPDINQDYVSYFNGTSYTFGAVASSPGGYDLYYDFSWGDGTFSGWIGPNPSSVTCEVSHHWVDGGVYKVSVKVANDPDDDGHGGSGNSSDAAYSEWSEPAFIKIDRRFVLPSDYNKINSDSAAPFESYYDIEGIVRIDLYSDDYPPADDYGVDVAGTVPFGQVWVFDLGKITQTYKGADEIYNTIFENGGIITSKSGRSIMLENFNIYNYSSYLVFKINLVRGVEPVSCSGTGIFKIKLKINNSFVRNQQDLAVSNFKLQMFGDHKDTWYDFLTMSLRNYKFARISPSDILLYDSGKQTRLILSSNILLTSVDGIL